MSQEVPMRVLNAQPASGSVPRLTPRQQRDPTTNMPIFSADQTISGSTLRRGLSSMATYISQNRRTVSVVAVGGAVNTILLRTRETTHDVDFFHSTTTGSETSLISQAGRYANHENNDSLGDNWFNNTTTLYMTRDLQAQLTREAEAQNEIVFQEPGLRVLAAPWNYAFCGKMDRLSKDTARPYDPNDAATYLQRYIARHGGRPVQIAQIQQWSKHFRTALRVEDLRQVNSVYKAMYGTDGIET